jgi:hypothetical protein
MRLDADRSAYADVEADGDPVHDPARAHARRRRPIARGRMVAVGVRRAGVARARGRRHAGVHDVIGELGATTAFTTVGIASSIVASTLRDGRLVAMMAVHGAAPRRGGREEIELVDIAAHRCWEAIARARAARVIESQRAALPRRRRRHAAAGVDRRRRRCRRLLQRRGPRLPRHRRRHVAADGPSRRLCTPTVAAWERALRDQEPFAFEHRLRMADGHYRWHLSRAEPSRAHRGVR